MNGERSSAPRNWQEEHQAVLDLIAVRDFPATHIFNLDETGIFYRETPKYTISKRGDNGAGAKQDKMRYTAVLLTNCDGSDRRVSVIGKSKRPTDAPFWRTNRVDYYNNSTAWCDREIFVKILRKLNSSLSEEIVLILDNFTGHVLDDWDPFTKIIPIYLAPNTTSLTQPLDAGIIGITKAMYKIKLMDFIVDRPDGEPFSPNEVTLKKSVSWLAAAFRNVDPLSIKKCFARCFPIQEIQSLLPQTVETLPQTELNLPNRESQMPVPLEELEAASRDLEEAITDYYQDGVDEARFLEFLYDQR